MIFSIRLATLVTFQSCGTAIAFKDIIALVYLLFTLLLYHFYLLMSILFLIFFLFFYILFFNIFFLYYIIIISFYNFNVNTFFYFSFNISIIFIIATITINIINKILNTIANVSIFLFLSWLHYKYIIDQIKSQYFFIFF